MKTTVVPAQITTVEDRVAGNFTLIQIVLLIIPMIIGASIYAIIAPKLHFDSLKLILITTQLILFGTLAFRIKGKIIADWLIILTRYAARPRRYVFTKSDPIYRDIVIEKTEPVAIPAEENAENKSKPINHLSLLEQIKIDRLFQNNATSISFKLQRKGGVDVSLKQIEN